jgi:hypothetical protein
MYALAAGAAGVGLLAAAPPAEAKIIYTPAHRVITPKHSFNIDFNHDGITDFRIANSVSACTDFCFFELRQRPADGNSAVGYTIGSGFPLDSALKPGARIGPRSPFKKGTAAMVVARSNVYTSNKTIVYGPWINVKDRYLGLKFQIKGKHSLRMGAAECQGRQNHDHGYVDWLRLRDHPEQTHHRRPDERAGRCHC